MPIITLTTDFGLTDPYVGIMKAVIAARCPDVQVVDFSHAIPAQDVAAAGLVLRRAWRFAPAGSVHVAVVDPGVGSQRRILVAEAGGHCFVVPDNGILGLAIRGELLTAVHVLDRPDWCLQPLSSTFHGRDVFAPTAAALAMGASVADAGLPATSWVQSTLPQARLVPHESPGCADSESGSWHGEIIAIDHFGNAITNLQLQHLDQVPSAVAICDGHRFPLRDHYAAVAEQSLVAIVGSDGDVELSVRNAHAAAYCGLRIGDAVVVEAGSESESEVVERDRF